MLTTRIDLEHLTEASQALLADLLLQESQQYTKILERNKTYTIERVDSTSLQTEIIEVTLTHDIILRQRNHDLNQWRFDVIDHQQKIGEGGFSEVYGIMATMALEKHQLKINKNKDRVVKIVHCAEEALHEIENEALISMRATSLHFKFPVMVKNADDTYTCYLVMRKLKGTDLDAIMTQMYQNLVTLSGFQRLTIAMNLLEALAKLHDQGIVHRDLKSNNILLDLNSGDLTIFDFGMSKFANTDDKGEFAGTLGFIPFEVYAGNGTTVKSDVYAAAINIALLFYADEPEKSQDDFIEYQFDHLFKDDSLDFTDKEKQALKQILLQMTALNAQERPTARQAFEALFKFRDDYVNRQIAEMAANRPPRYVIKKGLFFDKSKEQEPLTVRPNMRSSCKF